LPKTSNEPSKAQPPGSSPLPSKCSQGASQDHAIIQDNFESDSKSGRSGLGRRVSHLNDRLYRPTYGRCLCDPPRILHPRGKAQAAKLLGLKSPQKLTYWLERLDLGPEHTRRCLLRQGRSHHQTARKDQTKNHRTKALASPQTSRIISTNR